MFCCMASVESVTCKLGRGPRLEYCVEFSTLDLQCAEIMLRLRGQCRNLHLHRRAQMKKVSVQLGTAKRVNCADHIAGRWTFDLVGSTMITSWTVAIV
mmetsp:Transcript_45650/g.109881  ORF Transcript_45650/g.109881 Transcript_45650/m.109881 type:complete len:98 (+) Transcript_45650:728-1021(+)